MKPRVLIADDDHDCRHIYGRYLEYVGMEAHTAANGEEAVEAALRLGPDVIVMDLAMPDLDGWHALRRLKSDGRTRAIPVIALTGQLVDDAAERLALAAGFVRFYRKPCLPATLAAAVEEALGDRNPVGAP